MTYRAGETQEETTEPRIHYTARIKVFGIGQDGFYVPTDRASFPEVQFIAVDNDVDSLRLVSADRKVMLAPPSSGSPVDSPTLAAYRAAREVAGELAGIIDDADIVFVSIGEGNAPVAGAGAAVAEEAKRSGALTVGVVRLPGRTQFSFVHPTTRLDEARPVQMLRESVDSLLVISDETSFRELLDAISG